MCVCVCWRVGVEEGLVGQKVIPGQKKFKFNYGNHCSYLCSGQAPRLWLNSGCVFSQLCGLGQST